MERTLILVKPDGVQRGLASEILGRFERKGLRFAAFKLMRVERGLAARHYAEHEGKPFYAGLLDYITSGPVVAAVLEGTQAIGVVRSLVGATRPNEAAPGTIRGDFGLDTGRNLVHASDSAESADREIALFFEPHELLDWERSADPWIFED